MTVFLQPSQFSEILSDPYMHERFGPLAERPYLVCDFRNGLSEEILLNKRLEQGLAQLNCPSIALTQKGAQNERLKIFDLVLDRLDSLDAVLTKIEGAPIAASVLVRTLRLTETMPPLDGLSVESMAYAALQQGSEFRAWRSTVSTPAPEFSSSSPPILITRQGDEQSELNITLNRAETRNAIDVEMRDALVEAFSFAQTDKTIRKIRLSAQGKCFSVGGALHEFGQISDPATAHAIRMSRLPARHLMALRSKLTMYVHGVCIGAGIEIPAFAYRIYANSNAFFQLPELSFGLIPGAGGCVSLPARIGRQRTAYMVLSGRRVNAKTALQWGLIDEIDDSI